MASPEEAARSASPSNNNDDTFPQFPQSTVPGPPSIISSRMTDIATDDGGDSDGQRGDTGGQRRSAFYQSDGQSRPGTARTGISSRGPPQPLRRGLSGKRVSGGGSTGSGFVMGQRPQSSTSRSHVPSLTSHAFFRPMSSQKLQAQRGAARPPTLTRPQVLSTQGSPMEETHDLARQSIVSNPPPAVGAQVSSEPAEMRPPPSRGTEMTEMDRITANTSPIGHNPTASITDSVRPLQRKAVEGRKLTVNVDKSYKGGNLPTPVRTPRSFRSSFLMPGRADSAQNGNREIQGGEKLESVASSPQLPPENHDPKQTSKKEKIKSKLGRNHEYFEGNTVFCLGGRLQNAKHRPVNIATGSMVVIPGILFFVFSAPWIWHNISPAIPVTFGYLFYICMSSFLHASGSDPGVCLTRSSRLSSLN